MQGGGCGGVGSRLIPVRRAFVSSARAENNALDLRQPGDVSGKIEQGGLRSDHMSSAAHWLVPAALTSGRRL